MQNLEVIKRGRDNGIDTVLRYTSSTGTEIYGLGVPVSYDSTGPWGRLGAM